MDFLGRATTLVRIVETGSFSAAARSLGLSLAAISRQMGSLEEELGAKLIVRTTRSLHLTEEGRRFHAHAARLVRDAEVARASVRPERAIGGSMVLSASVTLGVLRILPAVPRLIAAHPALDLDLRLEDHAADLVSEGVDVAVRAGLALPDTTSLVAQPLATYQRVLCASPSYLRKHGSPRSVSALSSHLAVVGSRSTATWTFLEAGAPRAVTLAAKMRVGTMLGLRAAAVAGVGIAVLPDFVVEAALEDRSLRALLPEARLAPVVAHALYRVENRGAPRVDAIVAHLRTTMPLASGAAS